MSPATRGTDSILANPESVARAREALAPIARADDVGDHLGVEMLADRLANHRFACLASGYAGWEWVVTVVRVPRARTATINETELLPGPDALLPPPWVPWADRLRPGDLSPGDVLPHRVDDPRLDPGPSPDMDDDDRAAVIELGLGRARVLSPLGRDAAATRWYRGSHGPTAPQAVRSAAPCSTCGFLVQLGGVLGGLFGVCSNEWSNRDGQVVSFNHGCGAHSETDALRSAGDWPADAPLVDDSVVIPLDLDRPAPAADPGDPGSDPAPEALSSAPGAPSVEDPSEPHENPESGDP
ncbi:MAG: DUF3027 domain-containing protein [Micrococcales bacterium]|nr:DUF3027 domain-containing protein [Micrococcales bacterium]